LNQKQKFLLAIVIVDEENFEGPFYVKQPFKNEPDIGVASVNFDLNELLNNAVIAQDSSTWFWINGREKI